MSTLVFNGATHQVTLNDAHGNPVGSWSAYNNVDSHATLTHLQNRSYTVQDTTAPHRHAANANGPYGSHGIVRFNVPGHPGIGVHSGRANARHLPGPAHPTMGCIRTTDAAMAAISTKRKGGDVSVQEGLSVFGRVGFDEAAIGVRQVEAEIMKAHFLAGNVAIGFAEVDLGMTGPVCQRHEHFLVARGVLVDVVAHDRVLPGKAMLVAQSLHNAIGSVTLLDVDLLVGFQDGIDDAGKRGELGGNRLLLALVTGRRSVLAYLLDRLAMDAEQPRGFPLAALVDHDGASDLGVEFH